jgi:tetratricopeptide (TPR) repeat protein
LISKYINIPNVDIRPSILGNAEIAWHSFKHNPAFGTGPNTFANDWALWQPKGIVQSPYWNVNFNSGYSALGTFAVTTGLIGFLALLLFLVVFMFRGIQSLGLALKDSSASYYIFTTLMISIYCWICFIVYNPNILLLALAFVSSGILIGLLVSKHLIPVREFSFLHDARRSFFSILGLVVLMVGSALIIYLYVNKFASVIYFSKSLNVQNTAESLARSEKMLVNAITLDKNDLYYRVLSQVYLNQIGVLASSKNVSEDALKSGLQQLINLAQSSAVSAVSQNPKQYLNYLNLGDVYSSLVPLAVSSSYESAISAYNQARELAPNNPSILLAQAQLELANKNKNEAKKFINQALEMKQNYTDAVFLLAQIESEEGNWSSAIKRAEEAGQISPNDPTIFFRLGLLRYNNTNYSGAISAFEQAVILDPSYLNARYFLGQSYQKVGRSGDALIQYNILKKVLPDNQGVQNAINSISKQIQPNQPPNQAPAEKNTSD